MTIIRSGYATTPRRNGSTRAHRQARALALQGATRCTCCGQTPTPNDPLEAGHVTPHADGGTRLVPMLRSCNRRLGRLELKGGA